MNYANRNITEFLEREFDSNPGHPPKYNSERRLLEYVDDNKFQQHLEVLMMLSRKIRLSHLLALLAGVLSRGRNE